MSRTLAILGFLMLAGTAGAQRKISRVLPLNADGAVRVYNTVGSVRITAWARDSIAVRTVLGRGSDFHMGGSRSGVKMFVEERDERNPEAAHLEISVPARAKVWVKTATADVAVTGVTGSLDVYVVGGTIRVAGNPADLNAEAIDGSIVIDGSPGWLRAKSASGDITLKGSSADAALTTVSGAILVDGTKFERGKFETVTGRIRFSGGFERGGAINFESHSGSIEIAVKASSPADFDVVSVAGPITNKLNSRRPVAGRYGRGSELSTSNGNGGTRVSVRSFKGAVTLRRL